MILRRGIPKKSLPGQWVSLHCIPICLAIKRTVMCMKRLVPGKLRKQPSVESVYENIREINTALVDAGYYAGSAIVEIEKENDIKIYASVGKKTHGRTVEPYLEQSNR